ncbi:MAG: hypothetical protein V4496_03185 [Pseudomonadota bacterium]
MQRTLSVGRGLIYRASALSASQVIRPKRSFHEKARHLLPGGLGEVYQVRGTNKEKNAQFIEEMIKKNPNMLVVFCESTVIASNIQDYDQRDQAIKDTIENIKEGKGIQAGVTLSPGHIAVFTENHYISHSPRTAKNSKDMLSSVKKVIEYDAEQYDKYSSSHETSCCILVLNPQKFDCQPMDIAIAEEELRDKGYDVFAKKVNSHSCATAVTGWSSGMLDMIDRSGMNPLACLYNLLERVTPIDLINEMRVFMKQVGIDRTLFEVSHAEAEIKFGPSSAKKASHDLAPNEEISHDTPTLKI